MDLGKRDPQGYYVIPAKRVELELPEGVEVEEVGDIILIKTKSRSLAQKIYKKLKKAGALAEV